MLYLTYEELKRNKGAILDTIKDAEFLLYLTYEELKLFLPELRFQQILPVVPYL